MPLLYAAFAAMGAVSLIALVFLVTRRAPPPARVWSLAGGCLLLGVSDVGAYWLWRIRANNIPLVHLAAIATWLFWLRPVVHSIHHPRLKAAGWGIWWLYLPAWVVSMASGGLWKMSSVIWPLWGAIALILVGFSLTKILPRDWRWMPALIALSLFAVTAIGPVLALCAREHAWLHPWLDRSVLILAAAPFFALSLVLSWSTSASTSTGHLPQH